MEEKLEKIKNAIEPVLKEQEIIVDSIEYVLENNYYFLRIILDQVNGIDLDTIVMATNLINPIIDEMDLFEESYILDVLSKERDIS